MFSWLIRSLRAVVGIGRPAGPAHALERLVVLDGDAALGLKADHPLLRLGIVLEGGQPAAEDHVIALLVLNQGYRLESGQIDPGIALFPCSLAGGEDEIIQLVAVRAGGILRRRDRGLDD